MKVNEIVKRIEEKFPLQLQEDYDNTGSQVLFPDERVKGIYICLDADSTTIDDAVNNNCNLIISHHPMIFRPVKNINAGDSRSNAIIKLIDKRVSLYSLHTNFDKIMFSYLSDVTGFSGGELLLKKGVLDDKDVGFGSFVSLEKTMTFNCVIEQIKNALKLDYLIYSGDLKNEIKSVAFINGAGSGSLEKIINSFKPGCIVTGDVGYHSVKYATDNNVCIIDAGHFGTENIFKKLLAESIKDIICVKDNYIDIRISDVEQNPFKIYR